jgi:pimeloyl-ACP methyl ester carboxylesterase
MPYVRANGLEIGYAVEGAGPPLILLHGASSSGREDFAAQLPLLRRAFRCYVPDARGHASTRWNVDDGFRYEWLVEDLAAFSTALGLATFHLVGFSMGGATAMGFAVRNPERLRTLVLAGISNDREPRASVARRLFDPERIRLRDSTWARDLARRHDPVQGEGAWERLLPAIARDVAAHDLPGPGELRRIDAPTLVVVGDRDPFVPVDHAWALRRQLPDARLLVIPDCGHEVARRKPALFNEALAGFYRSTEPVAKRRAEAHAGAGRTTPVGRAAAWTSSLGDTDASAAPDVDWLEEASR